MTATESIRLPWETIVGMGSYLVGDKYCNLDSKSVITTTQVVCGSSGNISEALAKIYTFVKNHISFGVPSKGDLNASQILSLGFGDATGKAILLCSMTRIAKIPTRLHGYLANPKLYAGLEPVSAARMMPRKILVIEVEVFIGEMWTALGGVPLDVTYLHRLSTILPPSEPPFGYGIADNRSLKNLQIELSRWDGKSDTCCQRQAYIEDLGIHTSAQSLIDKNLLKAPKSLVWSSTIAPQITRSIARIRGS